MKYIIATILLTLFTSYSYSDDLGYDGFNAEGKSVEQTLEDLKNDKSFSVQEQDGWVIASSNQGVMFSFTPKNHDAHPAYVERRVIEREGAIHIAMSVRCGASKEACDALVKSFQELNKKIMESMNP
ncbi:molecular chaperone DnaJ [Pseudoalteromonas sp. SG44-8]|uniref:molecular chaperone DnaJ n=1 Tax=Pseudoalteromonas sp. SG44-8 TaxID=2760958 RepID=UPI0015FF5966|nr:molecular chaperone DnaJ [Pseudoalteromonas sp. SG44-8]MBB1400095.1 molecular chaperone DnaJ [Pseudoalteromonas sp. SG44-8]